MPDLRGFGRSAVPAGGYNPRQFADDAIALLDALDIRQAGVIATTGAASRPSSGVSGTSRARASQLLYRHYLKAATEVFIRHVHSRRRLTVADDWRLNLLDGCGHWTPEERPDAVAAAARELF